MMHGVAITEREVETRTYSGKILMYPRQFLDAYFNNKLPKPINVIEL